MKTHPVGLMSTIPDTRTKPVGLMSAMPDTSTQPVGLMSAMPDTSTHPVGLMSTIPDTRTKPVGVISCLGIPRLRQSLGCMVIYSSTLHCALPQVSRASWSKIHRMCWLGLE